MRLLINLDTPPSIEEDPPVAGVVGVPECAMLADSGRRTPSGPEAKFVKDVFLDIVSTGAGVAVAEIEDIAGGALAECDGLRRREAISWSVGRVSSSGRASSVSEGCPFVR